ncbi:MAG: hypothetical protein KJ579_06135 [Verrucomicrobia bacterium]|nr:hypothetical protein [Verrucomicrobiota bacterium]
MIDRHTRHEVDAQFRATGRIIIPLTAEEGGQGDEVKMDAAFEKGLPLAIRIDGLEAAGRHPIHFIEGEISGDEPWCIGTAEVRAIDHGDPRAAEWNRWAAYKATPEGELSSREEAREEITGARGR